MSLIRRILGFPGWVLETIFCWVVSIIVFIVVYIVGTAILDSYIKYGDQAREFADRYYDDMDDPLIEEAPFYYFNFDPENLEYLDIEEKWNAIRSEEGCS